jgi:hypothetical protein
MNIIKFGVLVLVFGALTLWLGKGIGTVEKENSQENVLGNSINAARNAANFLKK